MSRIFIPALAAAALVMAAPQSASAHARLVSSTPAAGASIAAPRTVSLTFSERTVAAFSKLEIEDGRGDRTTLRTTVSRDGRTLTAPVGRTLAAGAYTVHWGIASADGHRMTGSYAFSVR
ncbi:copper homeostasis periplasmic binding protein CopC [Brevundimonas sp. S30B]|jgi:copper resistance protein C|uniref:copper homeostasis periplasmic binding protein CopC n=1 Tax=unclassified Brevundimonas TaxID=2622653 RepID=UPI0010725209|nr:MULTISPECIES: copper homeostasis periplasmic binding protein CopC [unclassified Brevundimonas]QBX37865.1 copper homeostasis periplasmic binding protein CopC [Brevundimonas sp. MF30-B]TFW02779.1 copper homeostasis periplasmic binding protein CopC [Brevundimonas sp. S30B]